MNHESNSRKRTEQMDRTAVPMTSSQRGMHFECLARESTDYHVTLHLVLDPIETDLLARALERVVAEQPALRATVRRDREGVRYEIAEHGAAALAVHDLRHRDDAAAEAERIAAELVAREFDLAEGPLVRAVHCRLDGEDRLILVGHHLVIDGASTSLIADRILALAADPEALAAPIVEDAGFAAYQRQRAKPLGEQRGARRREYWEEHLAGQEAPDLRHWLDPIEGESQGRELRLPLDAGLRARLRAAAMDAEVTEHTVYLGAFGLLLSHYASTERLSIATPFTDRPMIEQERSAGCFINTLPVDLDTGREQTVREMLSKHAREVIRTWQHFDFPVAEILGDYPGLAGVYDIAFIQGSYPAFPAGVRGESRAERVAFPGLLTVLVQQVGEHGELLFQYREPALDEARVRRFGERYLDLLARIGEHLDAPVHELRPIGEAEERELLERLRDTRLFDVEPAHLGRLFLERTGAEPARVCWRDERRGYSGAWAHDAAVLVQRRLLEATGGEPRPVGILMPRGAELLAAIFGTLLAGCAYVPIAENAPVERIRQIAEDAGLGHVLTLAPVAVELPEGLERLDLDAWREFAALRDDAREEIAEPPADVALDPDDVLYIEYTSGSTGLPKGVVIRHRSIHNTALDLERRFPLGADDVYLLKTSFTFDIFGTEIYGWLCGAGVLEVLAPGLELDAMALVRRIVETGTTHVNFSPTMLRVVLDVLRRGGAARGLDGLRHVFVGGEALTADVMRSWFELAPPCRLENVYGPTEASMWATHSSIERADADSIAPIGAPLNDYRVYALDRWDRPLGPGLPGELCIAGAGVAVGYLNRDELNARQFVDDPFFDPERDDDRMRPMYRTGDLGYLREDGRFAFLQRIDRQVKIGGVRVELGEIEQAMHRVEGLIEAAALVDESGGQPQLIAIYTANGELEPTAIREALAAHLLPGHIPARFHRLDALPVNAAGKLDRRALRALLAVEPAPAQPAAPAPAPAAPAPAPATPAARRRAAGDAVVEACSPPGARCSASTRSTSTSRSSRRAATRSTS